MRFSVIIPGHEPHLQCFREVAESVTWALLELGHEVAPYYQGTSFSPPVGTRPIYFGMPLNLPTSAILYNGEQVSPQSIWSARRLDVAYRNHTIWDYSPVNAERYADYQLPRPSVVRPGHCPLLERRIHHGEKTHDVVFFGSSNPRREHVLRQIEELGLSLLRVPFGLYGAERDAVIAKARLCLNIHFYEQAIFESVRCSYLIHNRVPIVSEVDVENSYRRWGAAGSPYEKLAAYTRSLLVDTPELDPLEGITLLAHSNLQTIDIKDDVAAAVEALDHAPVTYVEKPKVTGATPELTLCMIVKNEAPVIERCLDSVKPYLKRWCIVDTGSTDGTQDIIRRVMADLPGSLHECEWKGFDGSRSESIERAREACQGQGWLLTLDADEILQVDGELLLPDDGYDCHDAWITRCIGCAPWGRTAFLRASKPWFYEMPRHEGLYCREHAPRAPNPLPNLLILSTYEGHRAQAGGHERFLEDARVLEDWLLQHPGHTRCQYYIAQSYRTAANTTPVDRALMQKAVMHFMKRAAMGGYDQEVHSALYWAADSMDRLGYPREQMHKTLLDAYNQRPSRAEALYSMGRYYREHGQYALAELFLRQAIRILPTTDIMPEVDLSIYEWKAKEELSVALTHLAVKSRDPEQWAEARDLNREVLEAPTLPPEDRQRVEVNLQECLKSAPD